MWPVTAILDGIDGELQCKVLLEGAGLGLAESQPHSGWAFPVVPPGHKLEIRVSEGLALSPLVADCSGPATEGTPPPVCIQCISSIPKLIFFLNSWMPSGHLQLQLEPALSPGFCRLFTFCFL